MDELISRREAIKWFFRPYSNEEYYSNLDVERALKAIPTVNAIPVEWLENRLNALFVEAIGASGLYGDRIGELAKSINEVIKLWKREQEAR